MDTPVLLGFPKLLAMLFVQLNYTLSLPKGEEGNDEREREREGRKPRPNLFCSLLLSSVIKCCLYLDVVVISLAMCVHLCSWLILWVNDESGLLVLAYKIERGQYMVIKEGSN